MPPKTFEEIEELAGRQERQGNSYMRALYEKAMQSKDPKTAIFTAEGKLLIREAREAIKNSVKDYLNNPPQGGPKKDSPEYEGSFIQMLNDALAKLSLMDTQLNDYVTEQTPSKFQAFAWYRKESDSYKASMKTLQDAMKLFDKCFEYKESDSDEWFRKLYASAANMLGIMETIEKGCLQVPAPGTKTENGKKVHFVNTVGREHQPMARYLVLDGNEYKSVEPQSYAESDAHYFDRKDDPLFTHDPCPEDVCQGALGNCYMLSMLSSIAAQDPQFIKDAMVDNGNDVTVRFFNKSHEPVYVTVDKKVPGLVDGKGEYKQIFSNGPLWVQIIEKAFAASGIMNDRVKAAEKGSYLGDHADIENHYALDFVSAFMGDSYIKRDIEDIRIPAPNKVNGNTYDELNFIVQVQEAVNSGMVLYAGTRFKKDDEAIKNEKTKDRDDFTGLYSNHAHSLHGIEKDNATGKYYVKVRNPHGHMGRVYENGTPKVEDDANGYNLVDIKMFGHYFDTVQCAYIEADTMSRMREKEASDLRAMYGDIVHVVESTLRQSDIFYLKFKNSPSFKQMRESSLNLKELFEAKHPSANSIKREFGNLFKSAHDYIDYRNKQLRDFSDECTDRAVNRYQMAELITSLETLYTNNPDMKKADLKELTECFGQLGNNPSPAKQAAVQVHQQRLDAAAEKQRQLAEAKTAKQQKTSAPVKKTESETKAPKKKSI